MEDVSRATKECHNFALKHAWDKKRTAGPLCRLFVGSTSKPEVKHQTCFCVVFTQRMRPRNLSGGLRGLQTESESIRRVFVWSSHKKRDQKGPFWWAPRLANRK